LDAFSGISVFPKSTQLPQVLKLLGLSGLTVRNLRALARVDLDGRFEVIFVFVFLPWLMASIVDGMVRGTGVFFALLCDLVVDAGLGFLFGGVVRHGDAGMEKLFN
jgi:hypothetical protein